MVGGGAGALRVILSHFAIGSLDLSCVAIILVLGRIVGPIGCRVRIISKKRLELLWESRKSDSAIARRDFSTWLRLAKNAHWSNWGALRQTFSSADQVGNCVVFDLGNNRFRLIGRVNYSAGIIYVLTPMDHLEYDEKRWVNDCGCHQPPPKKPAAAKKTSPRQRRRVARGPQRGK